jgi:hypothetical protein
MTEKHVTLIDDLTSEVVSCYELQSKMPNENFLVTKRLTSVNLRRLTTSILDKQHDRFYPMLNKQHEIIIARISIYNTLSDLPMLNKQHEIMKFCNGYRRERVLSGVNVITNSHKQKLTNIKLTNQAFFLFSYKNFNTSILFTFIIF